MKTYPLLPVALLLFANILGFSLLIPTLPFIVRSYGFGEIAYGLLISSFFIFQLFAAPVLGSLSDRYGRKPILMASHFGTLVSWVIFGAAWFLPPAPVFGIPLPILVIGLSRVIDGITGGNVSVAYAYLADITSHSERTKSFGLMGAVIGLGMIVGPVLGSFSGSTRFGYLGLALIAFCISLATLVIMGLFLKESLPVQQRSKQAKIKLFTQFNLLNSLRRYRTTPLIIRILSIRAFFSLAMTAYTSIVVFYLIDHFGFSQIEIGLFALAVGSFLIFNQAVLVGRFERRWGDIPTLLTGLLSMMTGLFFLPFAGMITVFIIVYYFINLGISFSNPAIKGILTKNVSLMSQGEINGIDQSIISLVSAIGPTFATITYASFGAGAFGIFGMLILLPLGYFLFCEFVSKDAIFFNRKSK